MTMKTGPSIISLEPSSSEGFYAKNLYAPHLSPFYPIDAGEPVP